MFASTMVFHTLNVSMCSTIDNIDRQPAITNLQFHEDPKWQKCAINLTKIRNFANTMNILRSKNFTFAFCLLMGCILLGNINFGVDAAEKEIPATKFGQNIGAPTMTILYCYSCGYRKAFDDYVNILSERYPQITVTGGNYDPPGFNMYLSRIVFAAKILFIVVIVSSFDIFGTIGQQMPGWWRHLLENKLYACMMVFFVGNMLEGQLVASGAFEITLNDVPVWSKLQTGRIPAPQELFQIIDNQLLFTEPIQENPDFVK